MCLRKILIEYVRIHSNLSCKKNVLFVPQEKFFPEIPFMKEFVVPYKISIGTSE